MNVASISTDLKAESMVGVMASLFRGNSVLCAERRWAVNQMGDSIIFMGGIAVGSLITMFICMVVIISDDIRREREREFRQENEDN